MLVLYDGKSRNYAHIFACLQDSFPSRTRPI